MVSQRLDLAALSKSLLVHALVIGMFFVSWKTADEVVTAKAMPMHITAMVMEKPQPKTAPKPQPKPAAQPKPPEPKPEPKKPEVKKPEPKPEPKKPEPKKPEIKKPEPKKPEAKKPEPKKPEPKKPEPKKTPPKKVEPTEDFSDILKSEMKQLEKQKPKAEAGKTAKPAAAPAAATATSDEEQDEIQQYIGLMQQTIKRYWVRPLSARTGMVVTLRINLLPGGELNDVNVVESSGNPGFDRSAMVAVQKAGRFSVPDDPVKFDRYFRTLKLQFNPEDLKY